MDTFKSKHGNFELGPFNFELDPYTIHTLGLVDNYSVFRTPKNDLINTTCVF